MVYLCRPQLTSCESRSWSRAAHSLQREPLVRWKTFVARFDRDRQSILSRRKRTVRVGRIGTRRVARQIKVQDRELAVGNQGGRQDARAIGRGGIRRVLEHHEEF